MTLSVLMGMALSLLYNLVIFYLGKMLSEPHQFRNYFGFSSKDEDPNNHARITYWIEKLGRVLIIIAVVGAISSVITSLTILYRMYF